MKKYETYKESGLEWLGCVPEHWETIKIKYLFSFGRGLNITKADLVEEGSPVISYGQIHSKSNTGVSITDELLRFVPMEIASAHPENKVHKGDFIFADTSEDKEGCGNCVYIDREGIYAGYHSLVLDGKGRNNKYLAYLFKSEPWRIQIRSKASGVKVFSITQSIMGESTVILPPLTEQLTIASYLDYKVSQIDVLIAEKEKMVADLKAYRSSVITEAVTKGLDKNVEMKESGDIIFNHIPKHWNMIPIKYLTDKVGSGVTPTGGANVYQQDGIIFLRSQNIYPTGLQLDDVVYISEEIDNNMSATRVNKGDVLLNITGASIGRCFTYNMDKRANVNQHVCIIRPKQGFLNGKFLQYIFNSNVGKNFISSVQNGANREGLNFEQIKNFSIPIPSLEEQKAIVGFLEEKLSKIDVSQTEIEQELSDLKSYKSSLITEAVTGKIDLRGWEQQKE